MASHSTIPPFDGHAVSTTPSLPRHPRAQTIHDASARTGPAIHAQNMGQFSPAATPSSAARGYLTDSSPAEGDIFYHSQVVTEEQHSTSSLSIPNYRRSPPIDHRQVDIATPEMAVNAVRPQNIYSYSPSAGSNSIVQTGAAIPMTAMDTLRSSNPYPSSNLLRTSFLRGHYYNPTQASSDFGAAGNHAMGSDFPLSYSPPIQSSYSHTSPHGSQSQWQNSADSYRVPGNSDLRTEPRQPWSYLASESQRGMSYGGRPSYPSVPPSLPHSSRPQWQNEVSSCLLLVNPDLRTELDQPPPHLDSKSQRGISHGGHPSHPLVTSTHTPHYSRSQSQNPTNSCSLSADPDLSTAPDPFELQRGTNHRGRPSYPPVPISYTSHCSGSQWQSTANSYPLPANPDLRTQPDQLSLHLASESQGGISHGGRPSCQPVPSTHTPPQSSRSQWQNPANSCPLLANPNLRTESGQSWSHVASQPNPGISRREHPSYQPVLTRHTLPHSSRSHWQNPANSFPLPANPDVHPPGQPWSPSAFESQPNISLGDHPSCQPAIRPNQDLFHGRGPRQSSPHRHTSLGRSSAQEGLLSCHWLDEGNVLCGYEGSQDALKAHMSTHLSGPQNAQICCRWKGCDYARRGQPGVHTMRCDSAWRHVLEIHLHIKFRKKV